MAWKTELEERAVRDIAALNRSMQRRVFHCIEARIATSHDPRSMGHVLTGPLTGLWRYRVGGYRFVCRIQEEAVTVLIVAVGHRNNIYDRFLQLSP